MYPTDDSALLRQYAENHSDEAFAALVTQHINLVYSVALRHVGAPHQAEEVTQAVFILLAKKALQLRHDKALSSWLFQATRLTASNFVRSETRRHHREQEAHMQSLLDESGSDVWRQIAPLLDSAVADLNETDRQAIMLRFYEGRNLREVGAVLGASEDAAEKRVSRAVDKLRMFFAKRGVTVGASGLVVVISANAVQAAPVGLAVTISTAAALAGTSIAATATATAVKTIAMTTLQKTIVGATLAVALGTGIYETRLVSRLRQHNQALQGQHESQVRQLTQALTTATNELAAITDENLRLRRNPPELLKLRGEVTGLRRELAQIRLDAIRQPQSTLSNLNDSLQTELQRRASVVEEIKRTFDKFPDKKIPELEILDSKDWVFISQVVNEQTDEEYRKAMSFAADVAEGKFANALHEGLRAYLQAHGEQFPVNLVELKPYLSASLDESVFNRYQIVPTETFADSHFDIAAKSVITQKVLRDQSARFIINPDRESRAPNVCIIPPAGN